MEPIISVVMPVYNGEAYLPEAIQGILDQTHKSLELIAVDDGSQDSSWKILQSFAQRDSRILLVRNLKNRGHREATNQAHRIARGEFLARNDQDDISHPARFELQLDYFRRHPRVGLLASSHKEMFGDGRVVIKTPSSNPLLNRWRLMFNMIFSHSSLMFRRSFFSADELLFRFAPAAFDYEICARFARKTDVGCLHEPLVTYRIHQGGLSTTSRHQMERSVKAISRRELRFLMGRSTFGKNVLDAVRRLALAKDVKNEDLQLVPCLMQIMNKFQQVTSADPASMHLIRRTWMKKLMRRSDPGQLIALITHGNLLQEMNSHWLPTLAMTARAFPRSCLRKMLGRQ